MISYSKITWNQPSSNEVLQPKNRWNVLCGITSTSLKNSISPEKSCDCHHGKRTSVFYTYLRSWVSSMLKLGKMINQNLLLQSTQRGFSVQIHLMDLVRVLQTLFTPTDNAIILLDRKSSGNIYITLRSSYTKEVFHCILVWILRAERWKDCLHKQRSHDTTHTPKGFTTYN